MDKECDAYKYKRIRIGKFTIESLENNNIQEIEKQGNNRD